MLRALQRHAKPAVAKATLAAALSTSSAPAASLRSHLSLSVRPAAAAAALPIRAFSTEPVAAAAAAAAPAAAEDLSNNGQTYDFGKRYRPRFGKRAVPRVSSGPMRLDDVLSKFLDKQQVPTGDAIKFEHIPCPPEMDAPVATLSPALRPAVRTKGVVATGPLDRLPQVDFPSHIYQPEEIRWDKIPPFVTASRDPVLLELIARNGGRFFSSTSSCSPILSQISFALTSFLPVQIPQISEWFSYMARTHTRAAVKPSCNILRRRRRNGVFANAAVSAAAAASTDAAGAGAGALKTGQEGDMWGMDNFPVGSPKRNQILIDLGKSLERQLTMDPAEFAATMVIPRDADNKLIPPSAEELAAAASTAGAVGDREAYRFVKAGSLVLRSQLDCYDDAVPGPKKVFDLKTRAVLPIRLDVENHADYLGYTIERKLGVYSSFEREWYDMARAAFLKYSFQCRIGDMGGILVGYHNTVQLFGFQYISLDEMDTAVYGSPQLAQAVYEQGVRLLEEALHRVVDDCATSAGTTHDAIRLTARAFSNRLEIFTETLPPLPPVGERTDADVEAVLLDLHAGVMYVDQLTEQEVRAALGRRNAKTTGSIPEVYARLEDLVAAADGVYTVPTVDYLVKRVNLDHVRMYTVALDVKVNGQTRKNLESFNGTTDKLSSMFQFRRVSTADVSPDDVAHAYAEALTEWLLREEDAPPMPTKAATEVAAGRHGQQAAKAAAGSARVSDAVAAAAARTGSYSPVVSTVTEAIVGANKTTTVFESGASAVMITNADGAVVSVTHYGSDRTLLASATGAQAATAAAALAEDAPAAAAAAAAMYGSDSARRARGSSRKVQAERILQERNKLEKYFGGQKGGISPETLMAIQRKRALDQTAGARSTRKVM